MKFSCDQCSAQYMIADEKVGTRGVKVKCKKCGHIIIVKLAAAAAEETAAAPAGNGDDTEVRRDTTVDTGGAFNAMFGGSSFNEPTQAMSASQLEGLKAASTDEPDASTSNVADTPATDQPADADAGGDAVGDAVGAPSFGDPPTGGFGAAVTDPASTNDAAAGAGFGAAGEGFGAAAGDAAAGEAPAGTGFGEGFGDGYTAPTTDTPGVGDLAASEGFGAGGGETDANFDAAFGDPQAGQAPLEPSGRDPGEKEWYVAIDDSQVGPVDLLEIEQRWDALEVDEDTLAWKGGMADWSPLAEIPELAYLVTERPQQRASAPVGASMSVGAGASIGATASPVGSSLGPVAFGGESGGEAGDVSWTPSAASALSSLVQDELEAPAAAAAPAAPAGPTPSEMGMPSFGAQDLFGGGEGGNGGSAPAAGAAAPEAAPFGAPPAADPFAGGSGSWATRKSSSGGGNKTLILVGLFVVVVVVAAAVVAVVLLRQPPPAASPQVAALQPGATAPPAAPGAKTPVPGAGEVATPAAPTVAPAPAKATSKASGSGGRRPGSRPRDKQKSPKPKPKSDVDSIFDKPRKPKPGRTNTLDRDDVKAGFNKNATNLKGCIKGAMQKGELARGSHKLILSWTIQSGGAVTGGRLVGPSSVMGTSLPGCFARNMRKWKFPPSKKATPVTGYPLSFKF